MADVGNLVAKLTLDSTEFSGAVDGIGEKLGSLASGIGSTLGGVTAAVGAAVGAAAAGVASLVKSSVQNFAEYEQLVGGVETLFKGSADTVKEYANQAFQTAGLSANQYMSTVTSFSASMIQALGGDTQAAADLSNQAIIDMSDNANKMGTDITAIAAWGWHTVGLRADGTVVATKCTGLLDCGQCEVSDWTDIVAVSAGGDEFGGSYMVGLKADGRVVAAGDTWNIREVSGWFFSIISEKA